MSKKTAPDTLTLGTRGSQLARAQTRWVADRLCHAHPHLRVRTEIITTTGDRQQDRPLPEIGGKGLFTDQLEQALLDGTIDLAVHSAKDLPTDLRPGLELLAVPVREDPRDAWVSAAGQPFDDLPPDSLVGTTSLRRQAQLLMRRPDLRFVGLRGNVDTRIRKVQVGQCAGAVLAMAGLNRTHLAQHVTHPFDPEVCLPAPGQGALALEGRTDDRRVIACLEPVNHTPTAVAVNCERAILHQLDAGCRAPVAVLAVVKETSLHCKALVASPTGQQCIRAQADGSVDRPIDVVQEIVNQLRENGAGRIIAACRNARNPE